MVQPSLPPTLKAIASRITLSVYSNECGLKKLFVFCFVDLHCLVFSATHLWIREKSRGNLQL